MSGGMELKTMVLDSPFCTLCGACLDWCPYIKNLEDHLVMPFVCSVSEGRCYTLCPRTFTDWHEIRAKFIQSPYSEELGSYVAIYKVRRNDPIYRQQDGGTVSTLLKTLLEENLAEAALLTGTDDNITPQTFLGISNEDIEKAAGSCFLAAPGLRQINSAVQKGIKRLAVVGRPCQIQAVRKYQMNQAILPQIDMITIGLFCMWSLNWAFKENFQNTYPGLSIDKISIPQHGLEVATSEGVRLLPIDLVKKYIRSGCNYCLDMTSELADISVGAYEAEPGWNTVLVRNQAGASLLQKAIDKGYLCREEYPVQELQRLKRASLNKKARSLRLLQSIEENGTKVFVDLSHPEYRQILDQAEGLVKS